MHLFRDISGKYSEIHKGFPLFFLSSLEKSDGAICMRLDAKQTLLEGTCPLSRCPQTAKFPVPILLGTGRRWVRKATAFRGRSEQDRSALCAGCCAVILKTFRWNVFNEISFSEIGGTQHIMSRQTIHRCRSLPQLQPNFEKSLTLFRKKAILKCIRVYPDSKRRCAGRGFLFWGSVSWQSNGSNNWKKY